MELSKVAGNRLGLHACVTARAFLCALGILVVLAVLVVGVVPDCAWASEASGATGTASASTGAASAAAEAASSAGGSAGASEGPQIRWLPVGLAVLLFIGAGLVAKFGKRK